LTDSQGNGKNDTSGATVTEHFWYVCLLGLLASVRSGSSPYVKRLNQVKQEESSVEHNTYIFKFKFKIRIKIWLHISTLKILVLLLRTICTQRDAAHENKRLNT
jgi:hypothetical protein